jgi:hypothetical protein
LKVASSSVLGPCSSVMMITSTVTTKIRNLAVTVSDMSCDIERALASIRHDYTVD